MTGAVRIRPLALASMLAASILAQEPVPAAPQVTVLQEYLFSVDLELMLRSGSETLARRHVRIEATPERPGRARAVVGPEPAGLAVGLRIAPRYDEQRGEAVLLLESEVGRPGGEVLVAHRELRAAENRVRLVELWRATDGSSRLVAAVVPRWTTRPRASTLVPGAEPLDIVVEMVERGTVVERHGLAALVGRPVRFEVLERSQGGDPARPRNVLTLELVPRTVRAGLVDLSARLFVRSDETAREAPGTTARPFVAEFRDWLAPDQALEIPLPNTGDGVERSFRVRPRF